MIKRIVKLTFQEDKTEDFVAIFQATKDKISAVDGCHHLEFWRATQHPNIFFTYSYWESETHLNAYRHSDLFQATWKKTKVLFADKPEAWSVAVVALTKDGNHLFNSKTSL